MKSIKSNLRALVHRRNHLFARTRNDPAHRLTYDWQELSALHWALQHLGEAYPDQLRDAEADESRKVAAAV
jgi:hypothetical protein